MPKWLDRVLGVDKQQESISSTEVYKMKLREVSVGQTADPYSMETVEKGMNGKDTAYMQPMIGEMTVNPGFKQKPSIRNSQDLHKVLKKFGNNIILNAIINTRANQVSMYCKPARNSETGVGYEIRLKEIEAEPTSHDVANIKRIESFLENTAVFSDQNRDNFTAFCKKLVRATYMYDQVNFEKVFDKDGNFIKFDTVDPTTIFLATNGEGKVIQKGERFVQVLDNRVVAKFNERELAFAVRNPRADIEVGQYGYPELEIALKQFIAHENTEVFNDRFFSHGGTTRGILHVKTGQQQSQQALDIFRREWRSSLAGINGSWQIPVVSAEDVKFVNMTPSANDMQFEKWLNYLINVISALYGIDPAEINFPNNGGATGSKGGSLNEGNSKEKMQASQNKGLQPLLRFIEDTVNTFIVAEFGNKYQFQFRGGDLSAQLDKLKITEQEGKIFRTVNEIRQEKGLEPIKGGDVILNGVHIQAIGQAIQEEQLAYQKQQDSLARLMEMSGGLENNAQEKEVEEDKAEEVTDTEVSFQDKQQGINGKSKKVNGKIDTNVGKDGQLKSEENMNSTKQGTDSLKK